MPNTISIKGKPNPDVNIVKNINNNNKINIKYVLEKCDYI